MTKLRFDNEMKFIADFRPQWAGMPLGEVWEVGDAMVMERLAKIHGALTSAEHRLYHIWLCEETCRNLESSEDLKHMVAGEDGLLCETFFSKARGYIQGEVSTEELSWLWDICGTGAHDAAEAWGKDGQGFDAFKTARSFRLLFVTHCLESDPINPAHIDLGLSWLPQPTPDERIAWLRSNVTNPNFNIDTE